MDFYALIITWISLQPLQLNNVCKMDDLYQLELSGVHNIPCGHCMHCHSADLAASIAILTDHFMT